MSSWVVTLASGSSSNHLTSDSLSSQLVKSTCMVTPLQSHPQAVPRTPQRGTREGVRSWSSPKKGSKSITFSFFWPNFFGCRDARCYCCCCLFTWEIQPLSKQWIVGWSQLFCVNLTSAGWTRLFGKRLTSAGWTQLFSNIWLQPAEVNFFPKSWFLINADNINREHSWLLRWKTQYVWKNQYMCKISFHLFRY